MRADARLVILDEPFRGLERERRCDLLERARAIWRRATLLCITHDVGETVAFDRVLVIIGGRIVEDGRPATLAMQPGSKYRAMLEADRNIREQLWNNGAWRRLTLDNGRVNDRGQEMPL
jgi:ABC-type transport system involved in cytochrome bd biosynthesis fused ATPase/permease subunit